MPHRTKPIRIMVVEDDSDTRANLRDILELDDHEVETAGSIAEALRRDDWPSYGMVILDRLLPDGTASDLLPKLHQLAPEAEVIVVTGLADLQGAIAALRQGAADYILKPLNADALRASLVRVAERRELRRARTRSETAFRLLVEAADCIIVILRPDHSILYFSPFAERLCGPCADETRGRDFLDAFVPESNRADFATALRHCLAGDSIGGFESPVTCRAGGERWCVWNFRRLDDYEGSPAALAVGQDITNLKDAQERVLQAERLAAIGQMVTGLAHESRNALQRSQACLEMLELKLADRPDLLDLIRRIQDAQDHLHHLYEDVRGYAAPIRLERSVCDLAGVWRETWANLEPQRKGRDAVLRERLPKPPISLDCLIDPFRMSQVFRNLFDNALAACRDPVIVEVEAGSSRLPDRSVLRVVVRDNGPGLDPEQRQKLFDPFYTTKTRGTGLGLAITKRIIEAHGGSIGANNGAGMGAEIIFTLPRGYP